MSHTLAIHWAATTHGTWLHGDARGSWRDGRLIGPDPFLEAETRARMRGDAVLLEAVEQAIVADVMRATVREQRHRVFAAAIQPCHFHLVLAPIRENLKTVVARFKWRTAAAVLKRRREMSAAAVGSAKPAGTVGDFLNPAGTAGLYSRTVPVRKLARRSLWTAGKFVVCIYSEHHLMNAIEYVRDHNRRSGLPADPYEWIEPPFPPAELAGERCYRSDVCDAPRIL